MRRARTATDERRDRQSSGLAEHGSDTIRQNGASAAALADSPADRRRREILAATMRVIAAHGLSDTTVERVALAAGVSAGLVIAYFKRKDLLLLETLHVVSADFEAARRAVIDHARGDAAQALSGLIDLTFDPAMSSPERIAVWYAFWGEANARRLYRDVVGTQDDHYLADIERLCAALIVQSGRTDLDAEAVAIGFAGTLEVLWQDILADGAEFDRARAVRIARAYLRALFPDCTPATPITR